MNARLVGAHLLRESRRPLGFHLERGLVLGGEVPDAARRARRLLVPAPGLDAARVRAPRRRRRRRNRNRRLGGGRGGRGRGRRAADGDARGRRARASRRRAQPALREPRDDEPAPKQHRGRVHVASSSACEERVNEWHATRPTKCLADETTPRRDAWRARP